MASLHMRAVVFAGGVIGVVALGIVALEKFLENRRSSSMANNDVPKIDVKDSYLPDYSGLMMNLAVFKRFVDTLVGTFPSGDRTLPRSFAKFEDNPDSSKSMMRVTFVRNPVLQQGVLMIVRKRPTLDTLQFDIIDAVSLFPSANAADTLTPASSNKYEVTPNNDGTYSLKVGDVATTLIRVAPVDPAELE